MPARRLFLFAPFPDSEAAIVMPMFAMGDTERMDSTVNVQKRFDGGLHTHVTKQLDSRILNWNFTLTRMKALEFKEFYILYAGKVWRFLDTVTDQTWTGYVKVNPATLNMVARGKIADSEDVVQVEIEFETTELPP